MQNVITTPAPIAAAPVAAKPAKAAKPAAITVAIANTTAPAPKAPSASATAIETHDKAGFTGASYSGLSKPRNSGITKAPNTATSKATPRTYAQLTERMHKTLAEIAKAYGKQSFPLIGIDRGQAAIFIASGFFVVTGTNAALSADTIKRYSVTKA